MKKKVKWTDLKNELSLKLVRKEVLEESEEGMKFKTIYRFGNKDALWYLYNNHKDMIHKSCKVIKEDEKYLLSQYNFLKFKSK